MEAARTVKDVSPHEFVKAYAAHLKRSGHVYLSLSFSIHKLLFLHVDDAYICFVLWIWNFYLLFCLIYFLVRSESDCSFGYLWLAIWWNIHWKLNIVDVWVAGQMGLFCTLMWIWKLKRKFYFSWKSQVPIFGIVPKMGFFWVVCVCVCWKPWFICKVIEMMDSMEPFVLRVVFIDVWAYLLGWRCGVKNSGVVVMSLANFFRGISNS